MFRPFWSMLCPIWSTSSLIQWEITIFSPCWWNFLSNFLLLSPCPPILDARMSQFVLSCPAVTGLKLQTMVLDESVSPPYMDILRKPSQTKKNLFFGHCPTWGGGGRGEWTPNWFWHFLWYKLLKLVCKGEPSQIDFDTFSVKQVAQTGCWGEGGVTCAMP